MGIDLLVTLWSALVVLVATTVHGITGFGTGQITMGVLPLFRDAASASIVVSIVVLFTNLRVFWSVRDEFNWQDWLIPVIGLAAGLPGAITREALYTLIPHPAKLVTMRLTGENILEILEQCATNQAPGDPRLIVGGLVQTAGLRWSVNFAQPAGRRVSAVYVRGEAIRKEKSYAIGTNTGMARGLHRYAAFTKGREVVIHDLQVNQLVERAFAQMGTVWPPGLGDITLLGGKD